MKGWKTWAAALALAVLVVLDIKHGDAPTGYQKIIPALALIGIGYKIEKAGRGE